MQKTLDEYIESGLKKLLSFKETAGIVIEEAGTALNPFSGTFTLENRLTKLM
ncbi:hypothetical protein JXB41_02715 [Candidatus Woesearchaeota archaeon]|nr:hypothetical protein [Candidatus Woesearchaeota archaeon]